MRELATLWLGEALGGVEVLCLKSMLAMGHCVTLYSYQPVANIPEGVTIADARAIWDAAEIVLHARTGSPAPHADIFRLKLLAQCNVIWADADLLLLAPIATAGDYVFAYESPTGIGNSLMALPKTSPALAQCLRVVDEFLLTNRPIGQLNNAFASAITGARHQMHIAHLGPHILTRALEQSGEIAFALPADHVYPIAIGNVRALVSRPMLVERALPSERMALHLWASRLKKALVRIGARANGEKLLANSYIGRACAHYDVDVRSLVANLHEIPTWPDAAKKRSPIHG